MRDEAKSDKSYGTAVILCGIFGLLGIHHFYLENFVHGAIDLGMVIGAVVLFAMGMPLAAGLLILVDMLHSLIVFYLLITEQARDGQGRRVTIH